MSTDASSIVRSIVDKRTSLRRVIRSLCEVAEFKLKVRDEPGPDKCEHVEEMLDDMNVQLVELIRLKKSDGFFSEILEHAPERQHTVDQIIKDYDQLLVDLEWMKEQLTRSDHAPTVRRLLHGWLTRFMELDSREVTLLQKVWNVDVGMMD